MRLKYISSILFLILSVVIRFPALADDIFHPEADSTLGQEKMWVSTTFKKGETGAITSFRAWIPYPPHQVWEILTDTNIWKNLHSEYKDSRSLDKNQFDLVIQKKPSDLKGFYELVGQEIFASNYYRQKNQAWTSYVLQVFDFPFPLSNRWCVMKVKNDETNAQQGEYRYDYKASLGNFKSLKGYWALIPLKDKKGWTEFRGEYKSDPGIEVPQFLAKATMKSSLKKDAEDNIKELGRRFGPPTQ